MQNLLEDFYLPVRGSESGTSIDTLSGIQFDSIQDIEYLKNRLLGSLKIPKAYLGYEEDTTGKATLASQDFRFARTVERIQRIMVSELYKIAVVHLYSQGFEDGDLVDFTLTLTAPSSVYEKEKVELWTSKVTLAGDMIDKKLFSRYWVYENLFNMAESDYLAEQDRIIQDTKEQFRMEQIKTEGNDPVKTGQSFGTAHDIAALYKGDGGVPKGYNEKSSELPPKGGWPGAGRPEEPGTYGTHEHPLGWDPLGNKANRKVHESTKKMALYESLIGQLDKKKNAIKETFKSDELVDRSSLLDEDNILQEE
jgi:Bacteriophage T4-like portal protein (Gp20)